MENARSIPRINAIASAPLVKGSPISTHLARKAYDMPVNQFEYIDEAVSQLGSQNIPYIPASNLLTRKIPAVQLPRNVVADRYEVLGTALTARTPTTIQVGATVQPNGAVTSFYSSLYLPLITFPTVTDASNGTNFTRAQYCTIKIEVNAPTLAVNDEEISTLEQAIFLATSSLIVVDDGTPARETSRIKRILRGATSLKGE